MAGPACIVVASRRAAPAEAEEFIRRVAGELAVDDILSLSDTTGFGGQYRGESRPFVIGIQTLTADEAEYAQLETLLGGTITCAVELGAMCNRAVDYVVLGELAAALAAKVHGRILLSHEVLASPRSGKMAVVTTGEGYRYSVVDSVALGDLLSRGIAALTK